MTRTLSPDQCRLADAYRREKAIYEELHKHTSYYASAEKLISWLTARMYAAENFASYMREKHPDTVEEWDTEWRADGIRHPDPPKTGT